MVWMALCLPFINAQDSVETTPLTSSSIKSVSAIRIENAPKIDGLQGEPEWLLAPVAKDFVENQPTPGEQPVHQTDVKIMYDNRAIYVSAVMYDSSPDSISRQLSERDGIGNADWFGIFLDPYQDGINGVSFIITASEGQFDAKYSTFGEDESWDAVWEAKTQITDKGWIAEFEIPYSAIRFPDKAVQTWGINFGRRINRTGEKSFWSEVNPQVDGFLNQSGKVTNIKDIKSPVRLSATPFVASYIQNHYDKDAEQVSSWGRSINGGMDIKYGLSDAFTLDMTLIPDFGEARSDNQVLNLSPFEVRFNENRQFFTEGVELFNKGGWFYSRRVGGRPLHFWDVEDQLEAGEEIIDNPQNVQLYNATKISGRTNKGLGVGFFNATAGATHATIENTELGTSRQVMTSPLTNYSVLALDQNLKNNSYITLLNTTVLRNGGEYDANVTGLVFQLNNKDRSYRINGEGAVTQKYYSDDTELGHTFDIEIGKSSGNLNWEIGYSEESDTYDPNDLGFLRANNSRNVNGWMEYNKFKPFWFFNRGQIGFWNGYNRLYKPNVFTSYTAEMWLWGQTKKFWNLNAWGGIRPTALYDYFETRTEGRYYKEPTRRNVGINVNSDYRKPFRFSFYTNYTKHDEDGRQRFNLGITPRLIVSDRFNFWVGMHNYNQKNDIGYANTNENGDIIFGRRDVKTVINELGANYNFSSTMNISLNARHYWSKVSYNRFNMLMEDGNLTDTYYNSFDDHNQSFNAFTIDMVYRWRFAPGSDIFLVWKNAIFGGDNLVNINYMENTRDLFKNPQTNTLSLKVIYYLDYLSLVKN